MDDERTEPIAARLRGEAGSGERARWRFSIRTDSELVRGIVSEIGSSEVRMVQVGSFQHCAHQVGTRQIGALEIGTLEIGASQIDAGQIGVCEIRSSQVGPSQVSPCQVGGRTLCILSNLTPVNNFDRRLGPARRLLMV